MKIHHLGLVVANVDEALSALGLDRSCIRETVRDPVQKNTLYFIHLAENNMWLELVEPTAEDSTTRNFAKRFEIGLHHLGMTAKDLEHTEVAYASRPGSFTLGRYRIRVDSFGGNIRTIFIAVKGLLLEFLRVEP